MSPHKIMFLLPSLRVGGAEKRTLSLIANLDKSRYSPMLVVQDANFPLRAEIPAGVELEDLATSRMRYVIPALRKALRKHRPDLMFVLMEHTCIAAAIAVRRERMQVPLVFSLRSNLNRSLAVIPGRTRWAYILAMKKYFRDARSIVAVSQGTADAFAGFAPDLRERIKVLPNPVISPAMLAMSAANPEHAWMSDGQGPIIVACGRLMPEKGFATLIEAVAQTDPALRARLIILGEGPERPHLESLIARLQMQDRVHLLGFTANPYAYMRRAALFVLSSRWEGMPGVLIEAMACGAPVVSTDCVAGPREVIQTGVNGLLATVDNPKALTNAIERMLSDPERARQMAQRGQASVSVYEERNACCAHEELFAEVLGIQQRAAESVGA